MSAKHLVQIVAVNKQSYAGKNGRPGGELFLAQCVVTTKTEGQDDKIMVGELLLPKHLSDTQPGQYVAAFELAIGFDKRVGSVLSSLVPLGGRPVAKAGA